MSPKYNPLTIPENLSEEQRRAMMRRGIYQPSGMTINPDTGGREWSAGGYRNPARIAFQQPESAGNVGPYYRERLEEMEAGGGRVPRSATGLPATTMPVAGQTMTESPAVRQARERWQTQEYVKNIMGQGAAGVAVNPAEQYQNQQIASLATPAGNMAGVMPTRTGTPEGTMANLSPVSPSLADTSFFPDQEIYTNPGAVDAGTLGAYQNRVNNFRRDFLQKAAQRRSNFGSVEEFKSFVESNPNYSPEIGTAAWDFAQSQLQRANPGLFQRITAQDKTREANNLSKVQWLDENMPNMPPGMTSEQKIQYMNANPELTQQWKDNAPRYRMNPANQLELIPPSPEKAYEIERRKTGQYFTEEEKADMAGQGVPIIQTPKGLLAPGDKGYDNFVAKVPVKDDDGNVVGYNRVPFGGVQLYKPPSIESPEVQRGRESAIQLGQKALQNKNISDVARKAIQEKINTLSAPTAPMTSSPSPTTPRGQGTITDASGNVVSSPSTSIRGQGMIMGAGGQQVSIGPDGKIINTSAQQGFQKMAEDQREDFRKAFENLKKRKEGR